MNKLSLNCDVPFSSSSLRNPLIQLVTMVRDPSFGCTHSGWNNSLFRNLKSRLRLVLRWSIPVLIAMGFYLPSFTFADFKFTFKNQTISVDQLTINSWTNKSPKPSNALLTDTDINMPDLISSFLGQNKSPSDKPIDYTNYNVSKIYQYIKTLSSKYNTQVIEPVFALENGRVTDFTPPQNGLEINTYASTINALDALDNNNKAVDLKFSETYPNTSLAKLNNLGISELIAEGVSNFAGSPNNRRHNITVGIEKFKGVIIPQGAEFSFNKNLGPVEKEQGFLPELVIKKTGTVPELGGGLCQVSSTTFRAAMAAGLPILERRNHAYAVQYYSPQGTDATIYPGVVDLKFVNNTPGAIMIWPYIKPPNTLIFDFYGTKDARHVTLEKPVQYDRMSDGSMKATWTREIFQNGTTTTDTFKSTYLPPALFHKPESTVAGTSTANFLSPLPAPSSLN